MYNNGNTSKNVTGASVVDGTIADADIDGSAAIATSKLSGAATDITSHGLASSATTDTTNASNIDSGTLSNDRLSLDISNSDVNASAEIAQSKLATLAITDSEVADNALSGNKIDGGTISDFASTGIDDNATETAITIDADENVGIGTTSPGDYHSLADNLVVYSSGDTGITIASGTSSDGRIFFADGTTGSAESMGQIYYNHANDSLHFVTADSGSAMTIDNSGNVLVGTTELDVGFWYNRYGVVLEDGGQIHAAVNGDSVIVANRNNSDGDVIEIRQAGSKEGSISVSGSTTSYNTSSDYRLKENVEPMTGSIDRLKELKPSRFNFISYPDVQVDGFLAHEAQTVVPEAISGEKDAMRTEEYEVTPAKGDAVTYLDTGEIAQTHATGIEEGQQAEGQSWVKTTEAVMGEREVPDYQGIDQAKLVPLLTSALQEAVARIEILENA